MSEVSQPNEQLKLKALSLLPSQILARQLLQTREELKLSSQAHEHAERDLNRTHTQLEQVKAERDQLKSALGDVADYQHRWSDSPITEVQKIARSILSQYNKLCVREDIRCTCEGPAGSLHESKCPAYKGDTHE